ncbi:MAG: hypothetical protein H7Y27_13650, partial [Gemmatimonadaceae bacterium]|nr:hypothetical protein [Chitinophagaceae bacterium]
MFKYNKLTIEGDNNIVLQDVDGQTITDSFENFLKKFTEEKDQRIASLERMVNMSESLSRLEVEKAGRELHDVRIEKEVLEKTVRKLVEDFNGKNLTETSGLYKQAFSLFTSGDLKTAIEVLNQRNIDDDLAEIEREERTAISKLEKSRSARRKLSEELAFKAQLLGVDSLIDQARQTFERAISIDRNIHTVGGYAFFLHFLQDYQNASELLVELLDTDLNNTEKAKVLNELGLIETAKNDFTGAAAHLSQALKLAGDNNDIHNLGMTNMNLGSVYTKLHNFESGLSSYLQAEKYLQDVLTHSVSDSNINSLALAKANSGWAYLELKQFEIAGTKYAEALNLFGDDRKE